MHVSRTGAIGRASVPTPRDNPWAGAGTLAALGELTARHLSGQLPHPGDGLGFVVTDTADLLTPPLGPRLAAISRAGLIPVHAQAQFSGTGPDGGEWVRYAAVQGLASSYVAAHLSSELRRTSCRILTHAGGATPPTQGIPVAYRDGFPRLVLGRPLTPSVLAMRLFRTVPREGLDAAAAATTVLVWQTDPALAPDDLWSVLGRVLGIA